MSGNVREVHGNLPPDSLIEHDGPLIVDGDITSGCQIVATGHIRVKGEVENAKVKSLRGDIRIDKGVRGVNAVIYAAEGAIQTEKAYNATLKASGDITIEKMAVDAHLVSKRCIFATTPEGRIDGGEAEAGHDIVVYAAGNSNNNASTIVRISDFKKREMFEKITSLVHEQEKLEKEITDLSKFIEVIKILGNKVVNLPFEKKQDLAMKVKLFNEKKVRLQEIKDQRAQIRDEHRQEDELERTIIIKGVVYSGVDVFIDDTHLAIQQRFQNVILYKRGIIIVGDYDKFMHRKKYAY